MDGPAAAGNDPANGLRGCDGGAWSKGGPSCHKSLGGAGGKKVWANGAVETLVELGFLREEAQRALEATDGDTSRAANHLLGVS